MKCFFCNEDVNLNTVMYYTVAGERVPFHRSLLTDCINEYLKQQERNNHEAYTLLVATAARRVC